jgi:hypothetical protein
MGPFCSFMGPQEQVEERSVALPKIWTPIIYTSETETFGIRLHFGEGADDFVDLQGGFTTQKEAEREIHTLKAANVSKDPVRVPKKS